jgi:hypothetical protein
MDNEQKSWRLKRIADKNEAEADAVEHAYTLAAQLGIYVVRNTL